MFSLLLDIPITSSDFWQSEDECTLDLLRHVFRSTTDEEIPLLEERLGCLREAGKVLYEVMLTRFLCVHHKPSKGMMSYAVMHVLIHALEVYPKSPPVY